MNDEIIKCLKCGNVLLSGYGMVAVFTPGTSIRCIKCGNKYVFGDRENLIRLEDRKDSLTKQKDK